MKVTVLGATGTIGHHISNVLESQGHHVTRASRATGVNAYTGAGLSEALHDAELAIDCLTIETLSAKRAIDYFTTTAQNLSDDALQTGVKRIVCVSIAGTADPAVNKFFSYYKAKAAQEEVYRSAPVDDSIIHSTQWFELIGDVVRRASFGPVTVLPTMRIAPLAAERAAHFVVEHCSRAGPGNHTVAVRGPEELTVLDAARAIHQARGEISGRKPRVMTQLPYFGSAMARGGLIPEDATTDPMDLYEWLYHGTKQSDTD